MKKKSNQKRNLSILFPSIAFVLVGVTLLLDVLNVAVIGLRGIWFPSLVILVGISLYVAIIVRRNSEFMIVATCAVIIGVMLLLLEIEPLNLQFKNLWPMILLAPSVSLLLVYFFRSKNKFLLSFGLFCTIISIALFIGALLEQWRIVAPLVIIFVGIVSALFSILARRAEEGEEYEIPSTSILRRKKDIENKSAHNKEKDEETK